MGARILSGATGTGAGAWVRSGAAHHGIIVTFTGSAAALTFTLEGRIAGGAAVTLGTKQFTSGELSANGAYLFVANVPVDDIRINVTVLTGSPTSIDAYYKSSLN
jgi:hypothetical protein